MRVSIPALFVLQMFVQKLLVGKTEMEAAMNESSAQADETAKISDVPEAPAKPKMAFSKLSKRDLRLLRIILAVFLVVGAACPAQEILRSVWFTIPAYASGSEVMLSLGNTLRESDVPFLRDAGSALVSQSRNGYLESDAKKTLDNVSITTTNFVASQEQNFFYQYLAREHDS